MHASARSAWQGFITKHEGNIGHMYLDTKGLVTIGIGNLIDPLSLATPLPFQFKIANRAGAPAGTTRDSTGDRDRMAVAEEPSQSDRPGSAGGPKL